MVGVLLDNVTIIVDKWPQWNYSGASTPAIYPNIEFDPSTAVSPTRKYKEAQRESTSLLAMSLRVAAVFASRQASL